MSNIKSLKLSKVNFWYDNILSNNYDVIYVYNINCLSNICDDVILNIISYLQIDTLNIFYNLNQRIFNLIMLRAGLLSIGLFKTEAIINNQSFANSLPVSKPNT